MGEKEHTLWAQLQLSFFPLRDGKVHILDVASLYAPAMLSPSTSSLLGIFFPYVKWRRMHFLKLLPLLALFPVFRISLPPRFIFFVSILISDSLLWSSSFLFPSFFLHILAFVLFFLLSAWGHIASVHPFEPLGWSTAWLTSLNACTRLPVADNQVLLLQYVYSSAQLHLDRDKGSLGLFAEY